jgi:filamentous hemagglutinin family protein
MPGRRIVAAIALLAICGNALADNILKRAGSAASPGQVPQPGAAQASAAAQEAAAAARRASSSLSRAREAIQSFQAAQDAARAAAITAPGDVPNGLGAGGLQVASDAERDPTLWEGAERPTQADAGGRAEVTVKQAQAKAILTWDTFNIGKETRLRFDQSAGGSNVRDWVVLNRVVDPSGRPSQILGSIDAVGQVYVVNRNGIVFGVASQVNVGALIASGMDFAPWPAATGSDVARRNEAFRKGILQAGFQAVDGQVAGEVAVSEGARIDVAPFGQAVLMGGKVTQAGSIQAPDGQVLLVAGDDVALRPAPGNRALELTRFGAGGATNTGIVAVPRGNITLAGAAVTQGGLLTVTTGADASGSILLGSDGFTTTLAEGSVTQILPDEGGKKVVGTGVFVPSKVQILGKDIRLEGGSTIYVPGGTVDVGTSPRITGASPSLGVRDDVRVHLEPGSLIDVSGLRDVEVPVEQNTIKAELRASELADNPVLRDGPLRGATVYFDARLGVTGVANLSGYYDLVERDVSQLMTGGGTVRLVGNEILLRQGSTIALSGGSIRYLDGYVRSTELVTGTGGRVRIEDAVAGERYVGLVGDSIARHPRWNVEDTFRFPLGRSSPRFQRGYVEGSSSGGLIVDTNAAGTGYSESAPYPEASPTGAFRILEGTVVADVVAGPLQHELPGASDAARSEATRGRSAATRERPAGARLELLRSGHVTVAGGAAQLPADFKSGDPVDESLRYQHLLPARWLDGTVFNSVTIKSGYTEDWTSAPAVSQSAPGGTLNVPRGVEIQLGDRGSFSFTGKRVDVDGSLVAPGGSVALNALDLPCSGPACGEAPPDHVNRIRLGGGASIDVAGRFTNDWRADGPRRPLDGGSVRLEAPEVVLEPGSRLEVSSGARLEASGTKLTGGGGGSIAIDVSRRPRGGFAEVVNPGGLTLGGTLSGYGVKSGGSLTLATPFAIVIGEELAATAGPGSFMLTPGSFTRGGFASYAVRGGRSLTVADGTVLAPSAELMLLPGVPRDLPGGIHLLPIADLRLLPVGQRAPMTLALSTQPNEIFAEDSMGLKVGGGAVIQMEPGSTVSLATLAELRVDGQVIAPGGRIQLRATETALLGGTSGTRKTRILLGPEARLLAPGYVKSTVDGLLVHRAVQPGGSIEISLEGQSTPGYTEGDLVIPAGAVLDVSGTRGLATLLSGPASEGERSRYQEAWIDGPAGSVSLRSQHGGIVAGTLLLHPGGESAAGGRLSVDARGSTSIVLGGEGAGPPELAVDARALSGSGADEIALSSYLIAFGGDVSLAARRSIQLSAGLLGMVPGADGSVALRAGQVSIAGGGRISSPVLTRTTSTASLAVEADLVDLTGTVQLGCPDGRCAGFGEARLAATGDIRLSSGSAGYLPGFVAAGLISPGAISLESAQVYVTSRARSAGAERVDGDPGFLVLSATGISVAGNGRPAPVPLSFGERLTLRAPVIVQAGILRAPQGQIRLEATSEAGAEGSVTLRPGSLTSASLEGLTVPYGDIEALGFLGYNTPGSAPTKSVLIQGAQVRVEPGAILDLSGGGDLLGYAFREGNGGSRDLLGDAGRFAILPGTVGAGPAPLDPAFVASSLKVGDAVFLQGVPGLQDGSYTLLPARYALLPGGLLLRQLPNWRNTYSAPPSPTSVKADGTVVAAGYRTAPGGVRDPGWSRFEVMDRATFGAYSEFITTSFNAFARTLAAESQVGVRVPADAGSAVLEASSRLELGGTGRFGASDGLLGNLDISATRIAVGAPREGFVALDPQALGALGAGSLLLGGVRSANPGGQGTNVKVNAVEVVVDAREAWVAPEIILAAKDRVAIADGSEIRTEGAKAGDTSKLLLTGDGALLRLSTGERAAIDRSGSTGATGSLIVGNAILGSQGSLSLDGSRAVELTPGVSLRAEQLDLASSRVLLGDAPADAQGTRLDGSLLASIGSSSNLLLRGRESIQMFRKASGAPLEIGGRDAAGARTLGSVALDTPIVLGDGAAGVTAQITTSELTLRNGGSAAASGLAGGGTLRVDVDKLALGPGEVRLGAMDGSAAAVEAKGSGSLSFTDGLSLRSAGWSAGAGVAYAITAAGAVVLSSAPVPAQSAAPAGIGGRLTLAGSAIDLDTRIVLPAGTFQSSATRGSLRVGPSGAVEVKGVQRTFGDLVKYAPGGAIVLSATGDLDVASGAVLDVSGSDTGGDAGRMEITAGGRASVEGDLRGKSATDPQGIAHRGGSFRLDSGTADFLPLNRKLESGGFDDAREIQLRQEPGGILLAAGEQVRAHRVVLRSDAGSVRVEGRIDASGGGARQDGGSVDLLASGNVVLTGSIDARAGQEADGGFEPASGKVLLGSSGGIVDVLSGATVDVSGGRQGGGSVVVRAPRRAGGDLDVEHLGGAFTGARERILQGLQRYDDVSSVDGAFASTLVSGAEAWLAVAGATAGSRLGIEGWHVAPAMLVVSGGDLAVGADVDLHALASPGHLALRARGDITLAAGVALSDGFDGVARRAPLLDAPSFGIGLEAGGNVRLAPGAAIRSGSGDVSVRAAGDVVLEGVKSVVYTAGRNTAPGKGFTAPVKADGATPMPVGEFPTMGGDIDIHAGGDIRAPIPTQSTSAWLYRYGGPKTPTSWSVVHGDFEQGVAALGGGDVRISAGRDVVQLDVAIPTTGHVTDPAALDGPGSDLPVLDHATLASLDLRGGGSLELRAGRDVRGGLFMLGRGHADVRAGGGVLTSVDQVELRNASSSPGVRSRRNVGLLLGLMDATASVSSASGVDIQAAFDPMRQGQVASNLDGGNGSGFWGYTERTAVGATSLAGEVRYWNDPWASVDPTLAGDARFRVTMSKENRLNTLAELFLRAPPTLRLTSFGSSVPLPRRFTDNVFLSMEPAARGTLEMLAGADVLIGIEVRMEDVAPEYRYGPLAPFAVNGGVAALPNLAGDANNYLRGDRPIHAGDPEPVRIYAQEGSVCSYLGGTCTKSATGTTRQAVISLPKPLQVLAGRDVVAGDYQPQHDDPGALSWIRAGRDLSDVALQVMGPGAAILEAGRDIVLSIPLTGQTVNSPDGGIVLGKGDNTRPSSTARQPNRALPAGQAASIHLLAGSAGGVDYSGFASAYLDPANTQAVVRTYLPELAIYMKGLGYGTLPEAELVAAFRTLSQERQRVFLDGVYFSELKETGIEYNDPDSPRHQSYSRGFRAVSMLFPTDPQTVADGAGGSVLLNGKPISTEALGDVTILAPYGRVLVGNPALDTSAKESGVVTRRGGDIRIMSNGNIDLETSRVFTLQGGDITMWTSNGSITAGTGSKTAVFQKPLSYLMSNDGVVSVNAFGISTGAGIGVLDALQDAGERERSRLDLIAPRGEVNAGDAGIRVVGDLNIAAQAVVGLENIQVSGGKASGLPEVKAPSLTLAATSDQVTRAATQEGIGPNPAAAQKALADLPSIITVEAVGYETEEQSEERRKR